MQILMTCFFQTRNHSVVMRLRVKWAYIDEAVTRSLLLPKNNACCLTYHRKKAVLCEYHLPPKHILFPSHSITAELC